MGEWRIECGECCSLDFKREGEKSNDGDINWYEWFIHDEHAWWEYLMGLQASRSMEFCPRCGKKVQYEAES